MREEFGETCLKIVIIYLH